MLLNFIIFLLYFSYCNTLYYLFRQWLLPPQALPAELKGIVPKACQLQPINLSLKMSCLPIIHQTSLKKELVSSEIVS